MKKCEYANVTSMHNILNFVNQAMHGKRVKTSTSKHQRSCKLKQKKKVTLNSHPISIGEDQKQLLSNKEERLQRLREVVDNWHAVGHTLVAGLSPHCMPIGNLASSKPLDYSKEDLAQLRHVIITEKRNEIIRHVIGKIRINPTYTAIFDLLKENLKQVTLIKGQNDKFDLLYAITFSLLEFTNNWLFSSYCREWKDNWNRTLKQLQSSWKTILKSSNQKLQIDEEYTRAGVHALLLRLRNLLNADNFLGLHFHWS